MMSLWSYYGGDLVSLLLLQLLLKPWSLAFGNLFNSIFSSQPVVAKCALASKTRSMVYLSQVKSKQKEQ